MGTVLTNVIICEQERSVSVRIHKNQSCHGDSIDAVAQHVALMGRQEMPFSIAAPHRQAQQWLATVSGNQCFSTPLRYMCQPVGQIHLIWMENMLKLVITDLRASTALSSMLVGDVLLI